MTSARALMKSANSLSLRGIDEPHDVMGHRLIGEDEQPISGSRETRVEEGLGPRALDFLDVGQDHDRRFHALERLHRGPPNITARGAFAVGAEPATPGLVHKYRRGRGSAD